MFSKGPARRTVLVGNKCDDDGGSGSTWAQLKRGLSKLIVGYEIRLMLIIGTILALTVCCPSIVNGQCLTAYYLPTFERQVIFSTLLIYEDRKTGCGYLL